MREIWARRLVVLTGLVVFALAMGFAAIHNLPVGVAKSATPDIERGKQVFQDQGCARCHSVAGIGSARSPLDGVGTRLSASEIRGRAIGTPDQQDALPPAVYRAKQAFQKLPEEEIGALIAYMQSLR